MSQQAKLELLQELSQETRNTLKIRAICRENPGVIDNSSTRLRVWSLLLLDVQELDESAASIQKSTSPCQEQHVLEADVRRTRANQEEFRTKIYQQALTDILQAFCLKHVVQYKQGMNEILAPFLHMQAPSKGTLLAFNLFDGFLFRYAERLVCQDDDSFLFKSFRMLQMLLTYHDPQLALHLLSQGFPPELYAPQWFLTLYARSLPLNSVLRLWDLVIAWDDCAFSFFIGICLLRRMRSGLLLAATDGIPELLAKMLIQEDEVDSLVAEAIVLYKSTPRTFLRSLRLCCVSSTELTPLPSHLRVRSHDPIHDHNLTAQSVRACLMMSPLELISYLVPLSSASADETIPQFVVIDLRASADIESSGGGSIPRAIQIEPEFLNSPDALEKWLEHFDGTRGCNIVIIDLPPVHASPSALWRRLLLGEGDGVSPASVYYGLSKNAASLVSMLSPFATMQKQLSPKKEEYDEDERAALVDDSTRPAVQLAKVLQKSNFNLVSVLDGGYPSLIDQLLQSRGTVEPVVVDFDNELWNKFMDTTGRSAQSAEAAKARRISYTERGPSRAQRVSDLTEEQRLQLAIKVAIRLKHTTTEKVLREKFNALSTHSS